MLAKQFGLQQDLEQYQTKLNNLYRQRKDVIKSIKFIKRRQRLINEAPRQYHQKQHKTDKLYDEGDIKDSQQKREELKKAATVQADIKDRNRRVFGGLKTYLKKAENKILEENPKVKQKQDLLEKAEQREKEHLTILEDQKKKEMEVSLEGLNKKKNDNSKELLMNESIILKNKFVAYVSGLQNFNFTKAQPSIAWKCRDGAVPNKDVSKKKENSFQKLKKDSDNVVRSIKQYNEKFDFSKYIFENEKQYYQHFLKNYFQNRKNFIITKAQPHIFWNANDSYKMHPKMVEIKKNSKEQLSEVMKDAQESSEKHYKKISEKEQLEERSEENSSDSDN